MLFVHKKIWRDKDESNNFFFRVCLNGNAYNIIKEKRNDSAIFAYQKLYIRQKCCFLSRRWWFIISNKQWNFLLKKLVFSRAKRGERQKCPSYHTQNWAWPTSILFFFLSLLLSCQCCSGYEGARRSRSAFPFDENQNSKKKIKIKNKKNPNEIRHELHTVGWWRRATIGTLFVIILITTQQPSEEEEAHAVK